MKSFIVAGMELTDALIPPATVEHTEPPLWFLGGLIRIRVVGEQTGGRLAVVEHEAHRGYGAPLHVHEDDDETFVVADGTLRFVVGDVEQTLDAGAIAVLPRQVPHAFVVTSETAKVLTLHTPSQFEAFVRAVGFEAPGAYVPPPAEEPPDVAALTAAAARHGITILGPPPAA